MEVKREEKRDPRVSDGYPHVLSPSSPKLFYYIPDKTSTRETLFQRIKQLLDLFLFSFARIGQPGFGIGIGFGIDN